MSIAEKTEAFWKRQIIKPLPGRLRVWPIPVPLGPCRVEGRKQRWQDGLVNAWAIVFNLNDSAAIVHHLSRFSMVH
ncbi:hypothetical protein [Roseibium aggregatum]|uniref:hypothetical protein n=1 Tax=Roseibium aggregatum TaxID=187304 RepID=UPI0025ABCE91|nr:hypothetical protein [Roseibium aggregatum]WJS05696.1 hypothetical protein QUB73_28660 [Roseibium aggregatum]